MEKIPGLRIVGDAPDTVKQKARNEIEERLTNHLASLSELDRKAAERFEYPKTPEEIILIDFANTETNRLRIEAGMEPYNIPQENYHILPRGDYRKIADDDNSKATCFFDKQGIIFDASDIRNSLVDAGSVILHETLHLKGHFSMEVEQDGDKITKSPYREGISASAAQKKGLHGEYHVHFTGLHEAIVAEQQKISLQRMMDLAILQKEKERLISEPAVNLRRVISEEKLIPEEDIIWVGENKKEYARIVYQKQRETLQYVCEEISEEFSDVYPTTESVFKEFLKAHFTGRLLPIARLIDDVFGRGSFRKLGDMKPDKQSGVLTLEALRKARAPRRKL